MNKSRLEAFSDGVFAIVITLLILDVHVPKVDYSELPKALKEIVPNMLTYALSFIIVGLYWISHHNVMHLVVKINRPTLWLNILYLMVVGFIPFPAALIGQYPTGKIPVIIYGCSLLAANALGFISWTYISSCKNLLRDDVTKGQIRATNRVFLWVNLFYVVAISLSFVSVFVSYAIFVLVIGFLILGRHDNKEKRGVM